MWTAEKQREPIGPGRELAQPLQIRQALDLGVKETLDTVQHTVVENEPVFALAVTDHMLEEGQVLAEALAAGGALLQELRQQLGELELLERGCGRGRVKGEQSLQEAAGELAHRSRRGAEQALSEPLACQAVVVGECGLCGLGLGVAEAVGLVLLVLVLVLQVLRRLLLLALLALFQRVFSPGCEILGLRL